MTCGFSLKIKLSLYGIISIQTLEIQIDYGLSSCKIVEKKCDLEKIENEFTHN